jgi:hypothetical protein
MVTTNFLCGNMVPVDQIVLIFCDIDDFCKELDGYVENGLLEDKSKKPKRGPKPVLSVSEVATIMVLYQMSKFKNFKAFYTTFLATYWKHHFPKLPSYNRFVELIKYSIMPLTMYSTIKKGKKTGIYYIDGTCLPVCHLKRSKRHKVFDGTSEFGKTSVGWFFGLKLHLVINNEGQLIAFKITKGNVNDVKAAYPLLSKLEGLAFGDKGYISKKLSEELMEGALKLITRKRKNMKDIEPIAALEKQLLNQRRIIETVFDHLKHHYQIWHTRHRSIINALCHLLAALAAYTIDPLKISALKLLSKTST